MVNVYKLMKTKQFFWNFDFCGNENYFSSFSVWIQKCWIFRRFVLGLSEGLFSYWFELNCYGLNCDKLYCKTYPKCDEGLNCSDKTNDEELKICTELNFDEEPYCWDGMNWQLAVWITTDIINCAVRFKIVSRLISW
jgi:hypothetical protein